MKSYCMQGVRNWELADYGALQHFIQLARTSSTNLLPYSSVKVDIVLTDNKVRTKSEIQCCWIVDEWSGTLLTAAYKPYLFVYDIYESLLVLSTIL